MFSIFNHTFLFHKEIKCHPERISKIKPFNLLESVTFPPQEQDFKTFEMKNKSIALSILQSGDNKKINHYYKPEFNRTRENKVILLILAVKSLNGLLKKRLNIVETIAQIALNCLEIRKLLKIINVNHFHSHYPNQFHSQ